MLKAISDGPSRESVWHSPWRCDVCGWKVLGASAAILNNQSSSCTAGDACEELRTSYLTYLANASALSVGLCFELISQA
jgi:NAD-dependent DNA ligase